MPSLSATIALQEGVFTRAQALEHVDRGAFARRVRRGEWRRVFPRVYAARPVDDDVRRRAALLYAGTGAVLSHGTAATVWGLPLPPAAVVHVSVPRQRFVASQPRLELHRSDVPGAGRASLHGVAVVRRELALVQAFGALPDAERQRLVFESVRQRLVSPRLVREHVGARAPGRRRLLALLDAAEAGTHSPLELRLLERVVRRHGLPEPIRQYAVGRAVVDLAWPWARLAVEADGRTWHLDPARRADDVRRDAELAALGWLTLRFTHEQVAHEPVWVAAVVAAALRQRGSVSPAGRRSSSGSA